MKDITVEERDKLVEILSFNMAVTDNDKLLELIHNRLKETPLLSAIMIRIGVDISNIPEMRIGTVIAHIIYLMFTLDDIRSEENAIQSNDT